MHRVSSFPESSAQIEITVPQNNSEMKRRRMRVNDIGRHRRSVVYERVVVFLVDHADLRPACLLHAVVSTLEAYDQKSC
jgi:hypothetical protein